MDILKVNQVNEYRETNWDDFINFIKDENCRLINKFENSKNLKKLNLKEQISNVNPFNITNIKIVKDTKSKNKEDVIELIKENEPILN